MHPSFGTETKSDPGLARSLGLFDATMIVMGGIVGSGIFMNPYVVARQVHTPFLILAVWVAGGVVALIGAFVYAELSSRRPQAGGQYAYIREAYHPAAAFIYGWALLLVTQTGGMAAVAVTFSRYFVELTATHLPDWAIAASVLAILTAINCLGVKAGSTTQSILMVLKIAAIAVLVFCGLVLGGDPGPKEWRGSLLDRPVSLDLLTSIGAAMVPVLFAYGGWQTSCFVAAEVRDPVRTLPRGLIVGVSGVIVLYLSVNIVCLRILGTSGLAATTTPASDVMRSVLGTAGARLIAAGIAISTLGFLSQSMLTAPRVYFAMAGDGLFFRSVAWLHPRSRVPVVAIALQGFCAVIIALSGRYEQILNYVVSVDFIFFGLSGACLFPLRRKDRGGAAKETCYRSPGHPWTTVIFVAACWLVVVNTVVKYPGNSMVGLGIVLSGIPVYLFWRWRNRRCRRPAI